MREAWRRWLNLTRRDRLTFLAALLLLPVASLVLRFGRYQSVISSLEEATPLKEQRTGTDLMMIAVRTAELVNAAARRGPYDATCLRRSMVLWWLLRWRGIDSQLRIGARMDENEFSAHAWVEYHDTVLNDSPDVQTHFVTLL